MRLLPVLDILDGVVVRGIGGKRDSYRPIDTPLTTSYSPLDVARAIFGTYGLREFYIADLDGLVRGHPDLRTIHALCESGLDLMVDAGIRNLMDARQLQDAGAARMIAALETLPGPEVLRKLLESLGPEEVIFSLDLVDGRPQGDLSAWNAADPFSIAAEAIELGITSIIVLDLEGVGSAAGPKAIPLCQRLRQEHPSLELITGGGIRDAADLRRLEQLKISGALVSTSLHAGTIPAPSSFRQPPAEQLAFRQQ